MAFANLFSRLSAVEEDDRSPAQQNFAHRNEPENGKRGNARKRKPQSEETGPNKKKQFHQAQTTRGNNASSFRGGGVKAMHHHMQNTQSEHTITKGQKYRTKNNHNGTQQQQNSERQINRHQQRDRWTPANRGGGHQSRPAWGRGRGDRKYKSNKQEVQVQRPRFMTEEFKDQNAMLVNGRLVCRHFLWGRCIKEDTCQLEHFKGYNDLVKEVCKFYIIGFCQKGESCPYMHESFPCKFFHRRGQCSKGADCKFSHEPLNDITTKLLDEALQKEKDLIELTKQSERESLRQPENTDESEMIEADKTPDIPLQPLRPVFYNSAEANTEKETTLCATEALTDEAAVPPRAPEEAQHQPPQSSNLNPEEPVCYSVEAVLGPQLFKPFPRLFTTPGCEEFGTSGSANPKEVPYSVNAVLRSFKSTLPIVQTVSYTPKTEGDEIAYPLLSSETPNKKVLYSENTRNEVNKSEMFKSLKVHTGLVSKTCPSLTPAYRDYTKQSDCRQESLNPRTAHEVKLGLLHTSVTVAKKSSENKDVRGSMHLHADMTSSINCKSEGGSTTHRSILPRAPNKTTPKQPTQLRPHISVLTVDPQASVKPSPSSSFTTCKGGAAAATVQPVTGSINTTDPTNSVSRHSAAKQPTEIPPPFKNTQSGLKCGTQEHRSTEITAECSSKMTHDTDLVVGCTKTPRTPFHSLFASPITDTLQHIDDSVRTSSCPQSPPPESADRTSVHVKSALETEKASARSFLSLFAAPLSAAPNPCMQPQTEDLKTSSGPQQSINNETNSKQSTSKLEKHLPHQVINAVKELAHVPRSPNLSPNPKVENKDSSLALVDQPTKQKLVPVRGVVSDSTHAHQQLPDISPHKGSAVASTAHSVLKNLFLSLSPYQQDAEQQGE
ncbi:uncharacterized protein LOC117562544 isoform X1 [Gymnodraco acuticeps]|uniref:Uncharacterized protein LOC117562544 isoform X1 n=3 Tax=Gymnodraco acuticeps TaxID=8218 RepID=A0A6P8VYL4_GYMAC|nr:uncharacterized protein LOC117562544 isoform X1 [Gymnodraco acuticeps]